jgi:uncharacterized membrane protein YheB (UPF0754 family)
MLYLIPFISAGIGWFTNYLAIKMLFYPRKERNFIFFKFQGIFPKRQEVLAARLAKIVAEELFSLEIIKQRVDNPNTRKDIKSRIEIEVAIYLRERVKAKIPLGANLILNDKRIEQIKDIICKEVEGFVPKIMEEFSYQLDKINIEKIVHTKVASFSSEKLENLLMGVLKKELKFIEIAGAILGFFIGLVQVLLILISL